MSGEFSNNVLSGMKGNGNNVSPEARFQFLQNAPGNLQTASPPSFKVPHGEYYRTSDPPPLLEAINQVPELEFEHDDPNDDGVVDEDDA